MTFLSLLKKIGAGKSSETTKGTAFDDFPMLSRGNQGRKNIGKWENQDSDAENRPKECIRASENEEIRNPMPKTTTKQ